MVTPTALLSACFFSLTQPILLGMSIPYLSSLFLLILPVGMASPALLFFCLANSYASFKTRFGSPCVCPPGIPNCSFAYIPLYFKSLGITLLWLMLSLPSVCLYSGLGPQSLVPESLSKC